MMFELLLFVILAPLMFLALRKTDDTNLQIGVLPLGVLLVVALPEGSAMSASVAVALGTVGYLAYFFGARVRREPMPDYASAGSSFPALEVALPDSTRPPGGFAPTPAGPDGPYYRPNSPAKRQLAEEGTKGEPMRFAGRILDNDGPSGGRRNHRNLACRRGGRVRSHRFQLSWAPDNESGWPVRFRYSETQGLRRSLHVAHRHRGFSFRSHPREDKGRGADLHHPGLVSR